MARIGIDIDDTITDTSAVIKQYVEKYAHEYKDGNILIEREANIIRGFFDHDVIVQFFLDHGKQIASSAKIRKHARQVIEELKKEGHEIIFITARSNQYYTNATKFCEDYLNEHNIIYDKVLTGKTFKVQACKDEQIDIMIDDGVDTCCDLNKAGIKAFLYTTPINRKRNVVSPRIKSWREAYTKIHDYLDEIGK